jgi:hypothetical protein
MAKSCRLKQSEQKAAIEIIRGGFWLKSASSFAMQCPAIEVLADRSWMWCKARDRADNLRSHHA